MGTLSWRVLPLVSLLAVITTVSVAAERGLVGIGSGANTALLVSVSHGLQGLDIDMANVLEMVEHPAYQFKAQSLKENGARVADIVKGLKQGAQDAKQDGTFLFYFTGHGNRGLIWPQDRTMKVEEIRKAIEEGRKSSGPLARLVLIYDSCHSGSLLDPMRLVPWRLAAYEGDAIESARVADAIVEELTAPSRDGRAYWSELMVIASSRADETSLASSQGSIFTLAMKKAFDEVVEANGTVGDFIAKSQKYTQGHHPVARLVPDTLKNELMVK